MNKKRNAILVLALMLSTVLITGLTFAYFSANSETKKNIFTIGEGISIQLAEPNFDGLDYDGIGTSQVTVTKLGKLNAENIMPGRIIDKNPSVKNNSLLEPVWVAIKLDYTISDTPGVYDSVTLANKLSAFATIKFDTANWMNADSDYTVFYYRTSVLPGENTTELFEFVKINELATELEPFKIYVTAYAIQEEGLTFDAAKIQLDSMILNP